MSRTAIKQERGLGWGFTASLIIHASLAAVALFARFPTPSLREAPVYYVDVVNLPVENPRMGSPTLEGGGSPPPPTSPTPKQEMSLPRPAATNAASLKQKAAPAEDSGKEFEERLARLQGAIDERRQEAAIDALRKKTAGSAPTPGQAGMPTGTGSQTGSDYASYIQSRLRDAFRSTIAHQTKSPEVVLKLTIDAAGHVAKQRIERSSGDRLFEESVIKAIVRAEKSFPPPPGGQEFEYGFIFRPQGVGKK